MVQKIRTSIIVMLTIINFIGVFSLFLCITSYGAKGTNKPYHKRNLLDNFNLNDKNILEYEMTLKNNSNYNIKKNRKLSYKNPLLYFYNNSILILTLIYLFFCITLVFSFCIDDNECECHCCRCCQGGCGHCDCNCNCNNNGGNDAVALIACLIIILIFIVIYYLTKLCGKHLSRYISLSFISFINFAIIILSLILPDLADLNIKYMIIISSILFLLNVLGILLPNFKKCEKLRYKYNQPNIPFIVNNIPSNQLYQTNNNITINHTLQSNNTYPVPIINNEYNVNPSIQTMQTNNSYNSTDKNLESSGNMGIPPLPIDVLPSKSEIYTNSS